MILHLWLYARFEECDTVLFETYVYFIDMFAHYEW